MTRDKVEKKLQELEQDHANILAVLNELAIEEIYNTQSLRFALIDKCFDYVSKHIIREEYLMCRTNYPDIANHENSHEALQATFLLYMRQILAGELNCQEAINITNSIFKDHIDTIDAPFYQWVKLKYNI